MDRLMAMRVFAEVAASGSFSASATRLEMSRAMVTRYVGEMEQWLQTRLLQRTTRRVTLTEAGEQCLRRCQQMLALAQDLEEDTLSTPGGALRGQLRVTSSVSFAYAQLGAALVDFLAQHPELKIDLNASEGPLNLVEQRIDLAIRISAEPDPLLVGRPLARCDSVLVASPAYLAAHGTPAEPAALVQHRCLSHASFGKSDWQLTRGVEVTRVRVASPLSANEATTLMRAALAGGGIALQPTYLVNPQLQSGVLQQVLPDWNLPALTIHALYPSRRHLSPAVRALLDFLVQRFAGAPWASAAERSQGKRQPEMP